MLLLLLDDSSGDARNDDCANYSSFDGDFGDEDDYGVDDDEMIIYDDKKRKLTLETAILVSGDGTEP